MENKRKIIFVTGVSIPNGMACTQRILNFARGFIANGVDVTILVIVPHDKRYQNNKVRGAIDGIEYVYTCGVVNRSRYFWIRRWHRFKGLISMLSYIINNRNNTDCILLLGCSKVIPGLLVSICSKIFNISVLHERTEIPFYNRTPKNITTKCYQFLYKKYFCRLFSGMMVISDRLENIYFEQKVKAVLKVPIIVNNNEFIAPPKKSQKKYFFCSGVLSQYQSGLIDLVNAFCVVAEKYPDVDLVLTGMPDREDVIECKEIIAQADVEDKVIFKGYIERDELLDLMMNAYCFVLPKPDNLQNRYCFASKIAEYVATGNPLITSKLGEICNYCEEGKNVFFVTPGSVNELSGKMIYVLQNPEHAAKVGAHGKELACSVFDNRLQAGKILNFIRAIRGSNEISC